ncbi:hypothetical protein TWF481_006276 [Arthrobotrys musiformis]|uniref:NACHT domain-containing protein n=1 Tax=Arthrobotrys musiformis TaxID=47236 RepID=A0AAV9WHL1_9PEZI
MQQRTLSPHLDPNMASHSITGEGFQKSLDKFRQRLSPEQRNRFSLSSLDDVKFEIQSIQERLGPDKNLRSFQRMKRFLEGMEQLEKLVQIFLNTSEVVAFVWGPIKLALMVASARVENLERLLGVYNEIGEVLNGVGKYDRLFKYYPDYRKVLEIYFYDILEFHYQVLNTFAKPSWKTALDYVWPAFKTKFEPIIESLRRHRELLTDEKSTVILEEVQHAHSILQDIRSRLERLQQGINNQARELRERILKQKENVRTKLRPRDYIEDHRLALNRRVVSSSGNWILADPKFKAWLHGGAAAERILYINGMPGSGKTILVSTIIDHLSRSRQTNNNHHTVLFFYFSDEGGNEASNAKADMFRALLMQLMDQDDTILEYLDQKFAGLADSDIRRESFLEESLGYCINKQSEISILIDALDESKKGSGGGLNSIVTWIQEVITVAAVQGIHVRFLVSGQRDGLVDQSLSLYLSIHLDGTDQHKDDIRNYVSLKASGIRTRFKLNASEETNIVCKVVEAAQGMFLYARVVLENLFSQPSIAHFRGELSRENFPTELGQAYERVAIRIFDRLHEAMRWSAVRILAWVATSGRPLRRREIQARFCIQPSDSSCEFEERMLDSFKTTCGSLVDVEPCEQYPDSEHEQIVRIVHPTAGKYLAQSRRILPFQEHADAAIYFSRYLTSHPFQGSVAKGEIQTIALTGYYALQDYACAFWHHHVILALSPPSDISPEFMETVVRCAEALILISQPEPSWTSPLDNLTATEGINLREGLIRTTNELSHISTEGSLLSQKIERIRSVIESIHHEVKFSDGTTIDAFKELHGPLRFKCPKVKCHHFATGFGKREERDDHVREHERPFRCSQLGCPARTTGFPSSRLLAGHIRYFHNSDPVPLFPKRGTSATIHRAVASGDLEAVKDFHRAGVSLLSPEKKKGGLTPLQLSITNGHLNICAYILEQNPSLANFWLLPKTSTWDWITSQTYSPLKEALRTDDIHLFETLKYSSGSQFSLDRLCDIVPAIVAYGSISILGGISDDFSSWKAIASEFISARSWEGICDCCKAVSQTSSDSLMKQTAIVHEFLAKLFPSFCKPGRKPPQRAFFTPERSESITNALNFLYLDKSWSLLSISISSRAYAVAECALDLIDMVDQTNASYAVEIRFLRQLVLKVEEDKDWMKLRMRNLAERLITATGITETNTVDAYGDLPLHDAINGGNLSCAEVLIPVTINLDQRSRSYDCTSLELAGMHNHRSIVKLLIESNRVDLTQNLQSQLGTPTLKYRGGKWYLNKDAIFDRSRDPNQDDLPICDYVPPEQESPLEPLSDTAPLEPLSDTTPLNL